MQNRYQWMRRLAALPAILLGLAIALTVYWLRDAFEKPPQTKKVVQQITVIQPPPPLPPEPPPPEEEIREQPMEETQAENEPEPEPEAPAEEQDDTPAGEELGLDADGSAGGDAFGLAARKGGHSLLGGGGGGNASIWYGGQVVRAVENSMQSALADTPAAGADYAVVVDIWIGSDGRMSRGELAGTSGNAEVDRALRQTLSRLRLSIGKAPPASMPQPVRIRLASRN